MRGCSADRISSLPCDVINRILVHMPLCDVVRTSILSRGWRYKWVTVPHLSFDRDFEKHLNINYNLESTIDQVLLLHKGDVVKFSLVDCEIENFAAINRWLFFLSDHRVEDLVISFSCEDTPMMPIHLFAFNHLTHLNIGHCEVKLPPTFKGFSRLVRLDLVYVSIESEDLEMWISKCPMLEYLNIDHNELCLDIDAPNLKVFHFFGGIESIGIKNSNLEEISILREHSPDDRGEVYLELPDSRRRESNLIGILGRMLSLKRLYLDFWAMTYFAEHGLPRKLPSDLNHLTLLELSTFIFGGMNDVACALCLIRSSPNLQSLKLSGSDRSETDRSDSETDRSDSDDEEGDDVVQYLKKQQKKMRRLKYVKICGVSYMEYNIELVKLFLRLATALEKLEIVSTYSESTDKQDKQDGYDMLKEIASFNRVSSRAVVIFD